MSIIVIKELDLKQDLGEQEMRKKAGGTGGLPLGFGMANTVMIRQIAGSLPASSSQGQRDKSAGNDYGQNIQEEDPIDTSGLGNIGL